MWISFYVPYSSYIYNYLYCIYEVWGTYEETPHINIKDLPPPSLPPSSNILITVLWSDIGKKTISNEFILMEHTCISSIFHRLIVKSLHSTLVWKFISWVLKWFRNGLVFYQLLSVATMCIHCQSLDLSSLKYHWLFTMYGMYFNTAGQ